MAYGNNSFVAVGWKGTIIQSNEAPSLSAGKLSVAGLSIEVTAAYPVVRLETSTNFMDWEKVTDLQLTNGSAVFIAPQGKDTPPGNRFFRALATP